MRIGVVGLGSAGCVLACLLADQGHEVTVIEQTSDPRPVGAGIWLQSLGQQVLDRLGLLEAVAARSRTVDRVDIVNRRGRSLLTLTYDDLPGSTPALGVHRGTLFELLHDAVRARGVPVELGVQVSGVRPVASGIAVDTATGEHSRHDLVIGADGARSTVRASMHVTRRDSEYSYGALWAVLDDPEQSTAGHLYQRLDGTRRYLGVLPTGRNEASLFWSERRRDMPGVMAAGIDRWRARARPLAGPYAHLLDRVSKLLPATYRDVVVRTPYRCNGPSGVVLVGDAAHAMSPQLGAGTSLALADAWTLAHAVAGNARVPDALRSYATLRSRHVRWYQWWTRLMMPLFQSDITPFAVPRDVLSPGLARVPGVPKVLVGTLCGDRVSPRKTWQLP